MTYRLGIDLGTTYTAAAVERNDKVTMATLGTRTPEIPTVVAFPEGGETLIGETAARRALTDPEVVAREFKRRVGDPVPIILNGTPRSPESLMASVLRHVLATVTDLQGAKPDDVIVTHPASWGPYKTEQLQQIFQLAGCDGAKPMTEPEAAARHYAARERVASGEVVAVFDFGGGTFDAAVLEHTSGGSYQLLGEASGIERLGGVDIDQAVFHHVIEELSIDLGSLEDSSATRVAIARLRADCTTAKEALSTDNATAIPVMFGSDYAEVRLTRADFEDMIRPNVLDAIDAIDMTVQSTGLSPSDISSILLVGGTSRIPLVSELVSAHFDRPTMVDTHPKHSTASGAVSTLLAPEVDEPIGEVAIGDAPQVVVEVEAGNQSNERSTPPLLSTAGDAAGSDADVVPSISPVDPAPDRHESETAPTSAFHKDFAGRAETVRRRLALVGGVAAALIVGVVLFLTLQPDDDSLSTTEVGDATAPTSTASSTLPETTTTTTNAPTTSVATTTPAPSLSSIIGDSTGRSAVGLAGQVLAIGSSGPTSPPQLQWQLSTTTFGAAVTLGDLVVLPQPDEAGIPFLTALEADTAAVAWEAERGQVGTVIVVENAVLNNTATVVRVLDPETGERIDDLKLPLVFGTAPIRLQSLQLVDGKLFAAGGYGEGAETTTFAVRFDLDTGDLLWSYEDVTLGWTALEPTLQLASDGETVILASKNAMVSLDAETGEELWRSLELTGSAALHLDAGVLITWPEPVRNEGFDARTGELLWEVLTRNLPNYASDGENFYIVVEGGSEVQARRLSTGDLVWKSQAVGGTALNQSTMLIGGDLLYAVAKSGTAAAFQRSTGQLVWSAKLDTIDPESFGFLQVSVGDGRMLILQDTTVRMYQ